MADPRITFTAEGAASFDMDLPEKPVMFRGFPVTDRAQRISIGGVAHSVTHDSFHIYQCEFPPVNIGTTPGRRFMQHLSGWWSHCARGGTFTFYLDSAVSLDTTLTSAASDTDTTLNVASTTGIAAGDWIYIEDLDDPTLFEKKYVSSTGGGPTIVVGRGLINNYVDNSIVRAAERFNNCILLGGNPPVQERDGGRGADLWDFRFQFRTTR